MAADSVGSTNPELLKRVAGLWDNPAWVEFFGRYEGFVKERCSVYGLDAASVDDLCQRVWFELALRMPSYQYDPGGSFRGWLRRLCYHRAVDLLRERRDHDFEALDGDELIAETGTAGGADEVLGCGESDARRLRLLTEALAVQEEVRRKVKPARWEAFWRVVIEGQSVKDVAASLGLKYATVYAGVNRVAQLLGEEGSRRKRALGIEDSANGLGA
ncbi:MAG: RNA polymerase sigma factor [Isosphaeraceae bacterium]